MAGTQKCDDLVIRVAEAVDYQRVLAGAFLATRSEEPAPRPEHSHVVYAEAAGRVVGCIAAERVYCVTLLHAEREYLGSRLPETMARIIERLNTERMREMLCTTSPHVERLAFKMGFKPIEGVLYRRG